MLNIPIITEDVQKDYEQRFLAAAPTGIPCICGHFGRACRQLKKEEGANRAACITCPLSAYAAGRRPQKLAEETHGTHIYMKLQLLSGRVEEIDVYTTAAGYYYCTTADTCDEEPPKGLRREIIQAFHDLY